MGRARRRPRRSLVSAQRRALAIVGALLALRCGGYGEETPARAPGPGPEGDGGLTALDGETLDDDAATAPDEPPPFDPLVDGGCYDGGNILESVDQQVFDRWARFEVADASITVTSSISSFPPASLYATAINKNKEVRAYVRRDICEPIPGSMQCELDVRIDGIGQGNIGLLDLLGENDSYFRLKTNEIQYRKETPNDGGGVITLDGSAATPDPPERRDFSIRTLPLGQFHRIRITIKSSELEVVGPGSATYVKLPISASLRLRSVRWGLLYRTGAAASTRDWEIYTDELRCAFGL